MELKGLFVGLTTIDIHYLVDAFPPSDSKTVAQDFAMSTGGPATNAAITFAHLGGDSQLVSSLGEGPFTAYMQRELQHYHVTHLDWLAPGAQFPTVSSIVTTRTSGHRAVLTTALPSVPPLNPSAMTTRLDQFDIILVDGFNMDACCAVATQARQQGVPVVLDGGSWKSGMDRLLPFIDVAICSQGFRPPQERWAGSPLDYLSHMGIHKRAITRGALPIIFADQGDVGEVPIEQVSVVDTLGAGDVYHGAFCRYYAERRDFASALLQASRVATLACQTFGTRAWMTRGGYAG